MDVAKTPRPDIGGIGDNSAAEPANFQPGGGNKGIPS
jgi:hypothetical protein